MNTGYFNLNSYKFFKLTAKGNNQPNKKVFSTQRHDQVHYKFITKPLTIRNCYYFTNILLYSFNQWKKDFFYSNLTKAFIHLTNEKKDFFYLF